MSLLKVLRPDTRLWLSVDDCSSSHVHPVLIDVIQESASPLRSVGCLVYKVRYRYLTMTASRSS